MVRLPLNEASAKIRTGPPVDADSDLDADAWAGVIPLVTTALDPEDAPDLKAGVAQPDYIVGYTPRS